MHRGSTELWSGTKCVCQEPIVCDKWWLHLPLLEQDPSTYLSLVKLSICTSLIGQFSAHPSDHMSPCVFMLWELTTLVSCPLSVRLVLSVVTAISRYFKYVYIFEEATVLQEIISRLNSVILVSSQYHYARRSQPLMPPGPLQCVRLPPGAPPRYWPRGLPQLPILRTLTHRCWSRSPIKHCCEYWSYHL